MSTKTDTQFKRTVRHFYKLHGRHDLPWRQTTDPYKIVVSEVMLQQTQVERVVPKYKAFIARWGSARALARAPLSDVLTAWQGLGYNRRAKFLHQCAKSVVGEHKGKWPRSYAALLKLPGIGPYTAGAVMAFAYNEPVPIIETNIRTVFLHHFFKNKTAVSEADLLLLTGVYLDHKNPREWYWALMDYGAYLKKMHGNLNRQAKSYAKQSKFLGSDRQLRGSIIRALTVGKHSRAQLHAHLPEFSVSQIDTQIERLLGERLIEAHKQSFKLPD